MLTFLKREYPNFIQINWNVYTHMFALSEHLDNIKCAKMDKNVLINENFPAILIGANGILLLDVFIYTFCD